MVTACYFLEVNSNCRSSILCCCKVVAVHRACEIESLTECCLLKEEIVGLTCYGSCVSGSNYGIITVVATLFNESTIHKFVSTAIVLHSCSSNCDCITNCIRNNESVAVNGLILEAFNNDSGIVVAVKSCNLTCKSKCSCNGFAVCKSIESVKDGFCIAANGCIATVIGKSTVTLNYLTDNTAGGCFICAVVVCDTCEYCDCIANRKIFTTVKSVAKNGLICHTVNYDINGNVVITGIVFILDGCDDTCEFIGTFKCLTGLKLVESLYDISGCVIFGNCGKLLLGKLFLNTACAVQTAGIRCCTRNIGNSGTGNRLICSG